MCYFLNKIQMKNLMKRHPLLVIGLLMLAPFTYAQTNFTEITPLPQVDSAGYFLQKGLTEKQNGRLLESYKNFMKALAYDENSLAINKELAIAYYNLRKYANARETYIKLVNLGEATAENYKKILDLSFQLKQKDDVLVYAGKLKEVDPNAKVAYYVGRVNYDMDNYGEAIKYLKQAIEEDPTNAQPPYLIAHSYADMMNYKLAVPYFKQAIALDTTQSYWIYELSLICYAMNNDKDALKYMLEAGEKGLRKDNDYYENLAIAYLNVGNLEKGVEMLNEILKRKPSDMNILNMIAEAYYYKGNFDKAIDYWDKILEYDKDNASSIYMIGMAYQKKGGKVNKEKGVKLCEIAIQKDPSLARYKQKKMMMGM